jgi:hypothetical protein
MAACLVRIREQTQVFDIFEATWDAHVDCLPHQAAKEWYKWLLQQPELAAADRSEAAIQIAMISIPSSSDHWRAFDSCLLHYVQANPSVSERWQPHLKRIERWLSRVNVSATIP